MNCRNPAAVLEVRWRHTAAHGLSLFPAVGSHQVHDEDGGTGLGELVDRPPEDHGIVEMMQQAVTNYRIVLLFRQLVGRQQTFEQAYALVQHLEVDHLACEHQHALGTLNGMDAAGGKGIGETLVISPGRIQGRAPPLHCLVGKVLFELA